MAENEETGKFLTRNRSSSVPVGKQNGGARRKTVALNKERTIDRTGKYKKSEMENYDITENAWR